MSYLKRYQALKMSRVAVSVIVTAMLTLLWIEFSDLFLCTFGWIERWLIVPVGFGISLIVIAFWIAMTTLFGRVYCSGICPLGTLQDVFARAGRSSRRGTGRHYRYSPPMNKLRYASLAVVVACWVVSLSIVPVIIEPDHMYSEFIINVLKPIWGHLNNVIARIGVATGWWSVTYVAGITVSIFAVSLSIVSILTVGTLAWFHGRTFCNTVCPVGTALGVASRQSLWHIDIDTDLCINCGKCGEVCKASCIDLKDHVVDGSRCVNCFNCLTVCPNDAIFYRPARKQLSLPMMQRIDAPKVGATSASVGGVDCCRSATVPAPAANDSINTDNQTNKSDETIS